MKVSEAFHPKDIAAHRMIKRICKLPDERVLTNQQALKKLIARLATREGDDVITDSEDQFLTEWARDTM